MPGKYENRCIGNCSFPKWVPNLTKMPKFQKGRLHFSQWIFDLKKTPNKLFPNNDPRVQIQVTKLIIWGILFFLSFILSFIIQKPMCFCKASQNFFHQVFPDFLFLEKIPEPWGIVHFWPIVFTFAHAPATGLPLSPLFFGFLFAVFSPGGFCIFAGIFFSKKSCHFWLFLHFGCFFLMQNRPTWCHRQADAALPTASSPATVLPPRTAWGRTPRVARAAGTRPGEAGGACVPPWNAARPFFSNNFLFIFYIIYVIMCIFITFLFYMCVCIIYSFFLCFSGIFSFSQ